MVGISGNTGERLAPVTASARTLPSRIWGAAVLMASNMTSTLPPITSTIAGPAPR